MEAMDIVLFCVVGLSVAVFLIVDSCRERRKCWLEGDDDIDRKINSECRSKVPESKSAMAYGSLERCDPCIEDWEGIERTELERRFGEAMVYVNSMNKRSIMLSEGVKLHLHALQMLVLQGSCYGTKPMPFNISARYKWNAWKKLGNMRREMAMEEYLNVVANAIPEWKKGENTEETVFSVD